mmetsp:Transcript_29148/g.84736  ORF Transcript_29148/g.84736 Transcript_29148/m.84736 type:complete len:217 (-) Transcript_29148:1697-2347(-)
MTPTTMTSESIGNMSGAARYGVGVRVLIPPLLRPQVARAMRRNHPGILAEDAVRAVVEARRRRLLPPPRRHLLHRPAAAAVKRVGAKGVVDVVVGAQEGSGAGKVARLAAGEMGEVVVGIRRPPVVRVQVGTVAAVVPLPLPPHPRRRLRGLDLGVARSVAGATVPQAFPRRSRWITRQVQIGARRRRSRKQMTNTPRLPLLLLQLRQLLHTTRKT